MAELFNDITYPVEGQPAPVSALLVEYGGRAPVRTAIAFAGALER